ncbi:hypothetical protein T459_19461 [Capsicum annuum]|uniref:Uncharacterized protein n=1 Tax=Capsicum annuum TaxID=4072 RepID=A0A2G2Z1S7_CAPAN|nr:hypothetical protein T459_19461 [Capsicum annuum]
MSMEVPFPVTAPSSYRPVQVLELKKRKKGVVLWWAIDLLLQMPKEDLVEVKFRLFDGSDDPLKETSENNNQSPKVTSKAAIIDNEAKKSPKKLIEKLSAALINITAKEDLVKQHAKVAEEAVVVRNTNEQTPNEQDVGSNVQNADQDSPNDHDVGVAEQSADPDGDTDEQVPNEQDVGATEKNVDQYGDVNEQVSDEQDLGAAEQNANQHEDINEQNHDQDGGTPMN